MLDKNNQTPTWFEGVKLNWAENMIWYRDVDPNKIALWEAGMWFM